MSTVRYGAYYPPCVQTAGLSEAYTEIVRLAEVAGRADARGDDQSAARAHGKVCQLLKQLERDLCSSGVDWSELDWVERDVRAVRQLANQNYEAWELSRERRRRGW